MRGKDGARMMAVIRRWGETNGYDIMGSTRPSAERDRERDPTDRRGTIIVAGC
jgi:hypothetical protein